MIELRPHAGLGHAHHGWLNARHHFSFADYHDPARMHWGRLRVWNDDTIAPQSGFPAHPHRDMEIITYVRQGAITHEDEETRIFQIWIFPERSGLAPSWGTRPFPRGERAGAFVTLASGIPDDAEVLPIRANARLVAATLAAGQSADYSIGNGRKVYLVPASGRLDINGVQAAAGDGVAVRDEAQLTVTALEDSEIVLVDVT